MHISKSFMQKKTFFSKKSAYFFAISLLFKLLIIVMKSEKSILNEECLPLSQDQFLKALEAGEFKEKLKPQIRELTLINGISFPSDRELVMLILGSGTKDCPVEKIASEALEVMDGSKAENMVENLCHVRGIGTNRALALAAAWELGRRRNSYLQKAISKPQDILPYVQHYAMYPTEHFITAVLNGAQEILSISVVSVGAANRAIVHPREVLAEAVTLHASAIICCHNHPGGHASPSGSDVDSTKCLQKAAEDLGISFLDHLIITKTSYFSFMENHML